MSLQLLPFLLLLCCLKMKRRILFKTKKEEEEMRKLPSLQIISFSPRGSSQSVDVHTTSLYTCLSSSSSWSFFFNLLKEKNFKSNAMAMACNNALLLLFLLLLQFQRLNNILNTLKSEDSPCEFQQ